MSSLFSFENDITVSNFISINATDTFFGVRRKHVSLEMVEGRGDEMAMGSLTGENEIEPRHLDHRTRAVPVVLNSLSRYCKYSVH